MIKLLKYVYAISFLDSSALKMCFTTDVLYMFSDMLVDYRFSCYVHYTIDLIVWLLDVFAGIRVLLYVS